MNWKAILNPWGEARRLQERVAYLEGQIDQVERWAEDTERRAYKAVADQYWHRNRMVEAQNAHMIQQMTKISSVMPFPPAFVERGDT